MVKNKKSAWELARRNFIQIAYLALILDIIIIGIFLAGVEPIASSFSIITIVLMTAVTLSWFYIASLYKNKNKHATSISYGFLGLAVLLNALQGIDPILLLIFAYLFYVVYKASKETLTINQETPSPDTNAPEVH